MIGAIIGDIVGSRWEFDPTNDYNVTLARTSMIGASDILTRWEAMVEGSHSGYRVIIPSHITASVMGLL